MLSDQNIRAAYLDLPTQHCCLSSLFSQSVRMGNFSSSPDAAVREAHRSLRCPKTVNTPPLTFSHTVVPLASLPVSEIAQGDWTRGRETWDQYVLFAQQMDHTVAKVLSSAQLWMRPWEVVPTKRVHIFHPALWSRQLHQYTFTLRYNLTQQKMQGP